MADQNIPFEYQTQFGQADELEQIAKQMMLQRAAIQRQMGGRTVPGGPGTPGIFVRDSPMQGLADMFAAWQGGQASNQANRLRQDIRRQMGAAEQGDVAKVMGLAQGKPIETQEGDFGPGERPTIGNQTFVAPKPMAAEQAGFASQWPRAQKIAERLMKERQSIYSANAPYSSPESLARAQGDPALLQPKEKDQWSAPYLAEVSPGLPRQMVQRNLATGEVRQVNRAPNQSVNVNANKDPEDPYLKKAGDLRATSDQAAYDAAITADQGNQALTRIEAIIAEKPPTGGPLATAEVWVRNLAAQYGLPLDNALDAANARVSAEFTSRIADQVLTGGRGISNDDAKRLEAAFPSFKTGIPTAQLPAFIAQLKAINNARIAGWNTRYEALPPKYRESYPITFGKQRAVPSSGVSPYQDPEKERRYQEWLKSQGQ